jgi:hypothetical protein
MNVSYVTNVTITRRNGARWFVATWLAKKATQLLCYSSGGAAFSVTIIITNRPRWNGAKSMLAASGISDNPIINLSTRTATVQRSAADYYPDSTYIVTLGPLRRDVNWYRAWPRPEPLKERRSNSQAACLPAAIPLTQLSSSMGTHSWLRTEITPHFRIIS